ncbi:MAG: methyltransferase domain-containing protein [Candidatus Latescibacterota bacterium]
MSAAIANTDQASAWDGEEGRYWVEQEEHFNAAARPYGTRLLQAARIAPGHHVLDIGCGCGESTREAARRAVPGEVLGVDLSAGMLARARQRATSEGLSNVRFEQGDAQVHPFETGAFHRAISRFGALFFADRLAAFRNIRRALRQDGRLALVAWRELRWNPWFLAIREALAAGRTLSEPRVGAPGGFGLADAEGVERVLTGAGFTAVELEAVDEPIYLGSDADDAFGFVRGMAPVQGLLEDLDEPAQQQALDALRLTLARHATGDGVRLGSSAWLITAQCA